MSRNERWRGAFRAIVAGEGESGHPLLGGEGGMLTLVTAVVLLFLMVLLALVINVGQAVHRKIAVQNAADAAAYSGALWLARGLNTLTATNHLMGELLSLAALQDAIGARTAPGEPPYDTRNADDRLNAAAAADDADDTPDDAYPTIRQPVTAAKTVGEGKNNLKLRLSDLLLAKAAAAAVRDTGLPGVSEVGEAVGFAVDLVESGLLLEWNALDAMEAVGKDLEPLRHAVVDALLPAARAFEDGVIDALPDLPGPTAVAIARENGCEGALYPDRPDLPVEPEAVSPQDASASQLVRAAYPWVVYDRGPLLDMMGWMIFSRARSLYARYTNEATASQAALYYRRPDSALYVLRDSGRTGKGNEPWTRDSRLADQLFTVVGVAHRPAPEVLWARYFSAGGAGGLFAYAQAMVYNANRQSPSQGPPAYQPEIGWDTLNWAPPVAASHALAYGTDPGGGSGCPRIRLNWQVKLIPVTRLEEATASLPGPFRAAFERAVPIPETFRTH